MTYDEIQKHLGEPATNTLTELVLRLNQASDSKSNPSAHNRALREFLSTMLALTLVRAPEVDPEADPVGEATERVEEIAREMLEVQNAPGFKKKPTLN